MKEHQVTISSGLDSATTVSELASSAASSSATGTGESGSSTGIWTLRL